MSELKESAITYDRQYEVIRKKSLGILLHPGSLKNGGTEKIYTLKQLSSKGERWLKYQIKNYLKPSSHNFIDILNTVAAIFTDWKSINGYIKY